MALPRAAVLNTALIGAFALAAWWVTPPAAGSSRFPAASFEPAAYGVPATLAGYPVLAVLTAANTPCMGPDEKRLVLLSDQPDVAGTVTHSRVGDVTREAARLGLSAYIQGGLEWVGGPGVTRESVIAQARQSSASMAQGGCIRLGGPIVIPNQATPAPQ